MAATIPTRQVASAAVGQSTTTSGRQVTTATLSNSLTGRKELKMKFADSATADINDLILIPGAWRKQSERAVPEGITFTAPKFNDFESMSEFFRAISSNVYGIRISTDNVANFLAQLVFTEKDPTGEEREVVIDLRDYRVPVGNGFSETIELTEADLDFIQWPGLELQLSQLLKSSYVDISFKVRGWNKAQTLSPLQQNIIG